MPSQDTVYSFRGDRIELLERGRDARLKAELYRDGSLVAPTQAGSTVTVTNAAGVAVVDAQAVTVSASVATYTVAAATLASETLGSGWVVTWSLVMPDGETYTYRRACALVRVVPSPVVVHADLYRRVRTLDPAHDDALHSLSASEIQDKLDEAWAEIQDELLKDARRPWLVVESVALRKSHLMLTLSLLFEDFASRQADVYQDQADRYYRLYRAAWRDVSFAYDEDNDGRSEAGRRAKAPLLITSGGWW